MGKIIKKKYTLKRIRQLPSLRLAYVRSMSGYNSKITKAWNTLFTWAYPNEIIHFNTRLFGIPLDDPEITAKNKCRYFASLTIDQNITPSGPIELMVLDKGWYANFPFSGTKSEMSSFYQYVYGTWLPESGYIPDDRPILEEYPNTNAQPSKRSSQERIFTFTLLLPIRSL
jgi:AraC family transcriptional regulator